MQQWDRDRCSYETIDLRRHDSDKSVNTAETDVSEHDKEGVLYDLPDGAVNLSYQYGVSHQSSDSLANIGRSHRKRPAYEVGVWLSPKASLQFES